MNARPNTRSLREVSGYLRRIADLFDASGVDELPGPAQVSVYVSPAVGGAASVALVDVIAAVIGTHPTWDRSSGSEFAWYSTELGTDEAWAVRSSTYTRHPFGDLRSENDALRARLAEIESLAGGVRTNVAVAPAQAAPDAVDALGAVVGAHQTAIRDRWRVSVDGSPSNLDVPPEIIAAEMAESHFDGVHERAGGRAGGPGDCAAWCACGVTFDGFDTIAEAGALVDGHVTAANAAPSDVDGGEPS